MQVSNISWKNSYFPHFAPLKQILCNINEPKQCISIWQTTWQTTEMSTLTKHRIGSFKTKANRQWKEVACPLSRRSWGGTRDKPLEQLRRRLVVDPIIYNHVLSKIPSPAVRCPAPLPLAQHGFHWRMAGSLLFCQHETKTFCDVPEI